MIAKIGQGPAGPHQDQLGRKLGAYTPIVASATFVVSNLCILIASVLMSQTAHIPSHRKPRRSASSRALRAGVTGGILTLTVAGTAVSASAAEPTAETTQELPTLTADLALNTVQSADATQQAAFSYQLQDQQEQAAGKAKSEAKKAKTEAERKAKEAKEHAERAAAKRAAAAEKAREQRASRTAERTTLSTTSTTSTSSTSGNSSDASSSDASSTPRTEAPSTSTGSGNAAAVVNFVKAQVGKAYIPGAMGPSSYDCSGLTSVAFRQVGVTLPRVSQDQSTFGTQVSLSNLQPGDILYWGSAGSAYHVAVYIGDGQFVGAQNSNTGVVQRSMSYDMPTGAVRVL